MSRTVSRALAMLAYQLRWALPLWFVQLATAWLPDNKLTLRLRGALARPFIRSCGRNFQLGRDVTLLNTHALDIGHDVYLAKGTWLNAMAGLTIEDEVLFAPYVTISTMQHVFRDGSARFAGSIGRPVRIGRGSWLAAHASVKCGVTIGSGSVLGANSVATRDIPPGMIALGVPAAVVGENREREAEVHGRHG